MGKNPNRPFRSGRFARIAICLGLSLVLAAGQTPIVALGDTTPSADSTAATQPERIREMLNQGDYIEHEALALVRSDIAAPTNDAMSMLSSAKTVMDVSSEAVAEVAGKADAPAEMRNASAEISTFSADDEASTPSAVIICVRDESKSTGQLIEELLATEGVLAAEPNYLVESADNAGAGDDAVDTTTGLGNSPEINLDGKAGNTASGNTGEGGAGATTNPNGGSATTDEGSSDDANSNDIGPANRIAPLAADAADTPVPKAAVRAVGSVVDATEFQWGKRNDGRLAGSAYAGEDINYPAWNQQTGVGGSGPIIAVLDSGVDGSNPELENKLWDSSAYPELANYPGGDAHGFSARERNSTTVAASDSSHGTHVAGIIAAEWNGEGTSGVSQNARIMALRHHDDTLSIVACFAYAAAAQNAGVPLVAINCSFAIGGGASTIVDTAITEVGLGAKKDQKGAISIFATGNSHTDVDKTFYSGSLLSENPYVIEVNSIDANGDISLYSNYGEKTTDLAAPGSTSLSTYPVSQQVYNGELDSAPTLYESFDSQSDATTGVGLNFKVCKQKPDGSYEQPSVQASTTGERSFDGDTSLMLEYTGDTNAVGNPVTQMVMSDAINISAARKAGSAEYLSIRFATPFEKGKDRSAQVSIGVFTKDDGAGKQVAMLSQVANSFMAVDGSWGGMTFKLPDSVVGADGIEREIDYENFQLIITGACMDVDMTAGKRLISPIGESVLIDSIGIGSTTVPYAYTQGTSMAAPEVTGAAAVIAENGTSRGIELAARVRAAASPSANLEDGLCLSNGTIDVQKGIDNPGPAITEIERSQDGKSILIWGYWFHDIDKLEVAVGGSPAVVTKVDSGEGGQMVITAELPSDFTGGQVEVRVRNTDTGEYAREFPVLGHSETATYYEKNLALPHTIEKWDKARLVGYNGDIYAMPQVSMFRMNEIYPSFERYSIDDDSWTTIDLPQEVIDSVNPGADGVHGMSATPYDGKLALLVAGEKEALWTLDQSGAWNCIWAASDDATTEWASYGTLASDGTYLYSFGGSEDNGDTLSVLRFDGASEWEYLGDLSRTAFSPEVSYSDGMFLVSSGYNSNDQGALQSGAECIEIDADGNMEETVLDFSRLYTESGAQPVASGAIKGGFMLVGPESDDGSADTYVLGSTLANAATAFDKRASDLALLAPSALAYKGTFYVLSKLQGSTENNGYAFVATGAETNEAAGDAADTEGLRYWYEQARAVDMSKYTEESAEVFYQAYLRAQALLESNPTIDEQAAVDEAAADLKLAIEGLVEKEGGQTGGPTDLDTPDANKTYDLAKTGDDTASLAAFALAGAGLAALAGIAALLVRRRMNR